MFKGLLDFKSQNILINWKIVSPVFFYFLISMLVLNSTSDAILFNESTFYRQAAWFGIGVFVFAVVQFVRVQYLYDSSYFLFFVLFLLIFSTIYSPVINGAQSWIVFGPFSFQPSEVGKVIYIIFLARFFTDFNDKENFSWLFLFMLVVLVFPPLLIFKQPDLGTAMIYLSVIIPMLYWSGFSAMVIFLLFSPFVSLIAVSNLFLFYFWVIFCIAVVLFYRQSLYRGLLNFFLNLICGLASNYIYDNILKDHHRERLEIIFDPYRDPLDKGYQIIQSLISIGSGGMIGKGLGNGTQTQLSFLPVSNSDFIVSVIAEEMGFITIFFILIFLSWFVFWCIDYATKIENKFASTLLIGCCTIIFMHFIINMGMVSGLLPVTGLPVPFISYGGTFLLTCSILIGLINNLVNNNI